MKNSNGQPLPLPKKKILLPRRKRKAERKRAKAIQARTIFLQPKKFTLTKSCPIPKEMKKPESILK